MTRQSVISDTSRPDPLSASHVWSVLRSSITFDPYDPAKFWRFRRVIFDHRTFVGTGSDLLERTGHADSREGYRHFLRRYCPEGIANEILAANGETFTYRTGKERLRRLHAQQPDYGQTDRSDLCAFFPDDVTPEDIDAGIDRQRLLALLPTAMRVLTPFERRVIDLRFGLGIRDGEQTLAQIGAVCGCPVERARQTVMRALRKLADAMHRQRSPLAPGPDHPLPLELRVDRQVPAALSGERRFYFLIRRYDAERYYDLVQQLYPDRFQWCPKETFVRIVKRLTK